jgi:CheY-like chemotaxis protein
VLVVEDDAGASYAMRRLLESAAFHVVAVATGAAGIESAHALRPDAIVLDLGLPDIDGVALVERLRGAPATRDIPIVVCTSRPHDHLGRAPPSDVVHAVLAKDEMSRALAASVRTAVAHGRLSRSEAA